MVVLDRQQIGLPGVEPSSGGTGLTLRAMPVAARVVGDLHLIAGGAAQYMSPQRRAAALFNGGHHLELPETQVALLCLPQACPWARKMSATSRAARPIGRSYAGTVCSSGLITSRSSSVATWA